MGGKLYLVATPIGNLEDITLRALNVLKEVDVIACEDTRHSQILLARYEIRKRLISCYKEKEQKSAEVIIQLLGEGKNVALITDAGMPCVSDPGAVVVNEVRNAGYDVTTVPGPSACVTAMSLTGITRRGFCFLGFLPEKNKDRAELLKQYSGIGTNLIFYASPHNINEDLKDMYAYLGERRVFVVKELTKMYESVKEMSLSSALVEEPRGEYVIVIEGKDYVNPDTEMSIEEHYKNNLKKLGNKKEAIKLTAKERSIPKDDVYKIALQCEE